MNIIFMGTPKFAVPALTELLQSDEFNVVAIYTRPPKASGRGMQLNKSPIHKIADEHNIKVFHPRTLKSDEELALLKMLDADIIVVAAYGLILPLSILNATKYGCINIHPSDLPRWRGAAPIQRTIFAGDRETALCIMQMDEGLDTGNVILRAKMNVPETMTAQELEKIMANIGAVKLIEVLRKIKTGQVQYEKQSTEGVTYANKINKSEERIKWTDDAIDIFNQIRALSPSPGAYFQYNGELIKVIESTYIKGDTQTDLKIPGTVVDKSLIIACGSNFIKPLLLQREGRKMLYTDAFCRGFPINIGEILD